MPSCRTHTDLACLYRIGEVSDLQSSVPGCTEPIMHDKATSALLQLLLQMATCNLTQKKLAELPWQRYFLTTRHVMHTLQRGALAWHHKR